MEVDFSLSELDERMGKPQKWAEAMAALQGIESAEHKGEGWRNVILELRCMQRSYLTACTEQQSN